MYDIAKKARAANRAKAHKLADRPVERVDSADWTPPPLLKADVKTGMRPVSRRAYKSGGKVSGTVAPVRADRKKRKAGGATEQPIVDRYVNRDLKKANEYRDGEKHIGGMKTGSRAKKESGGGTGPNRFFDPMYGLSDEQKAMVKKGVDPFGADRMLHLKESKPKATEQAPLPPRRPTASEIDNMNAMGKSGMKKGGRAKKQDGGPMTDPRLGLVKNKALEFAQNLPTPGLKKGGKVKHSDVAEDKALIKKMVKGKALKDAKCGGGRAERNAGGRIGKLGGGGLAGLGKVGGGGLGSLGGAGAKPMPNPLNAMPRTSAPSGIASLGSNPAMMGGVTGKNVNMGSTPAMPVNNGIGGMGGGMLSPQPFMPDRATYSGPMGGGMLPPGSGGFSPFGGVPANAGQMTPMNVQQMPANASAMNMLPPGSGGIASLAQNQLQSQLDADKARYGYVSTGPGAPPPQFGGGQLPVRDYAAPPQFRGLFDSPAVQRPPIDSPAVQGPPNFMLGGYKDYLKGARQGGDNNPMNRSNFRQFRQMLRNEIDQNPELAPPQFGGRGGIGGLGGPLGTGFDAQGRGIYDANPNMITRKSGGRVAKATGGGLEDGYRKGGSPKGRGRTQVNIIIGKGQDQQNPAQMMQGQQMPPMAPPAMPPMGGQPPMPQMGGAGAPQMPPMGGQPPMGFKSGGRITKVARSYKDMEAGAGSGEGRLQKTDIAKRNPKPKFDEGFNPYEGRGYPNKVLGATGGRTARKEGGKVYRSYKDMDAGAGSGKGRLEKTEIESRKK